MATVFLRIIALLAAGALTTATASAHPIAIGGRANAPRGPAMILFWASWCVSCRAELERLPDLERAAFPLNVFTLALDPPDVARAALAKFGIPSAGAFADADAPADILAHWGGVGAALPLAVAIDADGRICGRRRGLLGTDQLKDWAARCSR